MDVNRKPSAVLPESRSRGAGWWSRTVRRSSPASARRWRWGSSCPARCPRATGSRLGRTSSPTSSCPSATIPPPPPTSRAPLPSRGRVRRRPTLSPRRPCTARAPSSPTGATPGSACSSRPRPGPDLPSGCGTRPCRPTRSPCLTCASPSWTGPRGWWGTWATPATRSPAARRTPCASWGRPASSGRASLSGAPWWSATAWATSRPRPWRAYASTCASTATPGPREGRKRPGTPPRRRRRWRARPPPSGWRGTTRPGAATSSRGCVAQRRGCTRSAPSSLSRPARRRWPGRATPWSPVSGGRSEFYWGDLHQHSYHDDGRGVPAASYAYARSTSFLDFCAVTPHQQFVLGPPLHRLGGPLERAWEELIAAAEAGAGPDLVTFLGSEASSLAPLAGHMNAYYLDHGNRPEFERLGLRPPQGGGRYPIETYAQYLAVLEELRGEVLLLPHAHAGGGPDRFDLPHRPAYQTSVEICSLHGVFEAFYRRWLRHGHLVGVHGGGDNHMTSAGNANPGFHYPNTNGLAADTPPKTRPAIWRGIKDGARTPPPPTGASSSSSRWTAARWAPSPPAVAARAPGRGAAYGRRGTAPVLSIALFRGDDVVRVYRPRPGRRRQLRLVWTDLFASRRVDDSRTTGRIAVPGGRGAWPPSTPSPGRTPSRRKTGPSGSAPTATPGSPGAFCWRPRRPRRPALQRARPAPGRDPAGGRAGGAPGRRRRARPDHSAPPRRSGSAPVAAVLAGAGPARVRPAGGLGGPGLAPRRPAPVGRRAGRGHRRAGRRLRRPWPRPPRVAAAPESATSTTSSAWSSSTAPSPGRARSGSARPAPVCPAGRGLPSTRR